MLINADRMPRPEQNTKGKQSIVELLTAGRLKEALLRASKHPDRSIREGYKALGQLLQDPPFNQPPFEMTEDPETGRIELVETVTDPARGARDVPLDLVGLGVAQVYYILARALLGNTRTAAIEEPEAHLHAPTTGIELRQVLERLVNEGYLDQLFIATHSNLFDLDPTGYYDVSQDERGATRVERKPLSEIDRQHLYEPGPAKHALTEFLRYMEADAIVFRRPDGSPVSVSEMLDMLQRDDDTALEFLRDVHGAAVRAVRVKHKKPGAPASES
jgi:AAA ATPase domain